MKNILKLIMDAVRIAIDKVVDKIPTKLSELENDVLTSDNALALSIEDGLIEPAGNNGYVLTDANGVIYTI